MLTFVGVCHLPLPPAPARRARACPGLQKLQRSVSLLSSRAFESKRCFGRGARKQRGRGSTTLLLPPLVVRNWERSLSLGSLLSRGSNLERKSGSLSVLDVSEPALVEALEMERGGEREEGGTVERKENRTAQTLLFAPVHSTVNGRLNLQSACIPPARHGTTRSATPKT